MPERRAQILTRLATVLGDIDGFPNFLRNRGDADPDERPCMVLLDGTETVHQNFEGRAGRVYARTASSVMMLEPGIFALLHAREAAKASEYEALLAECRKEVVYKILHDEELADITGANGDIAWRGFDTDMQSGRTMQGEMQFFFRFYYVVDPSQDLA